MRNEGMVETESQLEVEASENKFWTNQNQWPLLFQGAMIFGIVLCNKERKGREKSIQNLKTTITRGKGWKTTFWTKPITFPYKRCNEKSTPLLYCNEMKCNSNVWLHETYYYGNVFYFTSFNV